MHITFIVEIALTVLLAATLVYCALLERRLAALRKGQDGLKQTIAQLNAAIDGAATSMRLLKSAASTAQESLDERLAKTRNVLDELSLLTASGERIADRIEKGSSERNRAAGTPGVLASRLDALKPGRADGRLAGQVR
ncbi:MAG TPA: DUF6468 domain-containing protein [Rhizomicrobium sp.]|nr:DUF6468 domain-containing protein [Rhizomicrobium sp.]